jgi:hypothetical protein
MHTSSPGSSDVPAHGTGEGQDDACREEYYTGGVFGVDELLLVGEPISGLRYGGVPITSYPAKRDNSDYQAKVCQRYHSRIAS